MTKRLIREAECRRTTGLARVTRWRLERRGQFPKRVEILPGVIGWDSEEIEAWVEARVAARDELISEEEAAHERAAG